MKILNNVVFLALLITLAACGSQDSGQSATDTAASSDSGNPFSAMLSPQDEYIFVLCIGNIEYFNAHKYEWEKLGNAFNITTTVMGPPDFDLSAMAAAMDQAIAKSPKGIAVWGVDPSLNPSIDKAMEAGIPVVTVIGDQRDSMRITYIGSHDRDLGYASGMRLAEELGGSGRVAILTLPGVEMFDIRESGSRDAFAEYPGIEVVATGDTKADTVTAIQAAKDIMVRFPDLDGFVGLDSTAAIGASTAVEELDAVGRVRVIGMDRNSDILEKVRDGILIGTVAQNDAATMYWALLTLMSRNNYRPMLTSDNEAAGARLEPDFIYLPPNYVNADNIDYYLEANNTYAEGF